MGLGPTSKYWSHLEARWETSPVAPAPAEAEPVAAAGLSVVPVPRPAVRDKTAPLEDVALD